MHNGATEIHSHTGKSQTEVIRRKTWYYVIAYAVLAAQRQPHEIFIKFFSLVSGRVHLSCTEHWIHFTEYFPLIRLAVRESRRNTSREPHWFQSKASASVTNIKFSIKFSAAIQVRPLRIQPYWCIRLRFMNRESYQHRIAWRNGEKCYFSLHHTQRRASNARYEINVHTDSRAASRSAENG